VARHQSVVERILLGLLEGIPPAALRGVRRQSSRDDAEWLVAWCVQSVLSVSDP